jgi:hypothetical protein
MVSKLSKNRLLNVVRGQLDAEESDAFIYKFSDARPHHDTRCTTCNAHARVLEGTDPDLPLECNEI